MSILDIGIRVERFRWGIIIRLFVGFVLRSRFVRKGLELGLDV